MVRRLLTNAALLLAVVTSLSSAAEREADSAKPESPIAGSRPADSSTSPADRPPDAGGQTGEPRRTAASRPRVLFITMKGCEKCKQELARLRRPGGDFEALKARGWKIGETADNHIQIVDREAIPELIEKLGVREYPTVACIADGEIVRSFKHGCTTPLDAWTFGWLIKGENERPHEPVPEAVQVASTGSYRLRGNHWSVDGDWNPARATVVSHLRGAHGNQIAANYAIESWSYEELRSLHDDLHEREMQTTGYSSGGYSSSGSYSSGGSSSGFSAGRKMLGR